MNPALPNSSNDPGRDSPPRGRLTILRLALLHLHKALLEVERREYERAHGHVSTGQLFRLVVDHPQFAWLHNISEFVVRLDEMLDGEAAVTFEDVRGVISVAQKMFTPSESGDSFQKKYFDAVQRDPKVVIALADLARLFADDSGESGPA